MEHIKRYFKKEIPFEDTTLIIEGPLPGSELEKLDFHEGLVAFRRPEQQKKALIEIADLPEGRINIIRDGNMIIGYVTFIHPDPLERWAEGNMEDLIELGSIEMAADYRGAQLGKNLLRFSMLDDAMEDYIIITTEYYWHWDLKNSGLDVWGYRKMMEKMMNAGGLIWYATDDPEICSHPANCLMVRIGKRVKPSSVEKFDQLRFQYRFMY